MNDSSNSHIQEVELPNFPSSLSLIGPPASRVIEYSVEGLSGAGRAKVVVTSMVVTGADCCRALAGGPRTGVGHAHFNSNIL